MYRYEASVKGRTRELRTTINRPHVLILHATGILRCFNLIFILHVPRIRANIRRSNSENYTARTCDLFVFDTYSYIIIRLRFVVFKTKAVIIFAMCITCMYLRRVVSYTDFIAFNAAAIANAKITLSHLFSWLSIIYRVRLIILQVLNNKLLQTRVR